MKATIECFSPNQNARAHPIRCVILHNDGSPKTAATVSWVQAEVSRVSYHLHIDRDGTVRRFVPDERRAWGVGYAAWRGVRDVNSVSLSLAFANRDDGKEALTDAQVAAAREIIADWRARWQIEEVTTHKIVSRWKDGKVLNAAGHRRKKDPEAAPNFSLAEFQ